MARVKLVLVVLNLFERVFNRLGNILLRNKDRKIWPKACNFIKKETLAQVFFCEFYKVSKNTFLTEHVWTAASISRLFISYYERFESFHLM